MAKNTYTILVVDDSEDDRFFIRRVISHFPRLKVVGEFSDGEEAIAFFSGNAEFADRQKYPIPDLVLLDLKMPRKNGFEVLKWLAAHFFPELAVIVLSGSPLAEDIQDSLALGAHGYWTKTAAQEKQNVIAQEIETLLDKRWSCQPH